MIVIKRAPGFAVVALSLAIGLASLTGCGPQAEPSGLSEIADGDRAAGAIRTTIEPVATPPEALAQIASLREALPEEETLKAPIDPAVIVNLGKLIWSIIDKNKPVLDVKYDYATALPQGVKASELEGFSDIQHKSYRIHGESIFKAVVYDLIYTLVYQYGGSYQGRGQYLTSVSIIPSKTKVAWGYKVDMEVKNTSTSNVGTQRDPVGSLNMELFFRAKSTFKAEAKAVLFQFRGDTPEVQSTLQ